MSANEDGHFQWSVSDTWDKNKCDHYYHNGEQVRFLRTAQLGGPAIIYMGPRKRKTPKWLGKLAHVMLWIIGVR
jgi:hypothetical protein